MAKELKLSGGVEGGLRKEAARVARKTLLYGKNWRRNGGGMVSVSFRDAIENWERQTGKKWSGR